DGWQLDVFDGSIYKEDCSSLKEYIQQLIYKPFDLSEDHMARATLIRLGEEEHLIVATVHHIASDGWSLSIMVGELVELYRSWQPYRLAVGLAPLEIQYAD